MKEPLYILDEAKIKDSELMISVYDHDLKIKFWNKSTAKRFNIPASLALGKCLTELFVNYDSDFRFQMMKDAVTKRKSFYLPSMPYIYSKGYYSQLILPVEQGIVIISSECDGNTATPRKTLLDAAIKEATYTFYDA